MAATAQIRDQDGLTPLHWAARKGLGLSLRVLVHLGADVGAVDCQRAPALLPPPPDSVVRTFGPLGALALSLQAVKARGVSVR